MQREQPFDDEELMPVYQEDELQAHLVDYSMGAGDGGQSVVLETARGEVYGVYHPCPNPEGAVLWVSGSRGGLDGPAGGIYKELAQELVDEGIASLRLDYRYPGMSQECIVDALAGVLFLEGMGISRSAVVGHSFGSAVALGVGSISSSIVAVVSMASQLYGSHNVHKISPRPLLLVHAADDAHLAPYHAEMIYNAALEPKELVILQEGGHGFRSGTVRDQLHDLLKRWLIAKLKGAK